MSEEDEDYGPTITRRRLGLIMERLRINAGLSAGEAAKAIECSTASLSRIENGLQGLSVHVAKSMLDVYQEVDQYEEILQLCRDSQRKGWWQAYGVNGRGYIGLEADAESVKTFEVLLIPGILQCPSYASRLFSITSDLKADKIKQVVAIRTIRQQRLRDERRPLQVEAIVHEVALRCPVGGVEVMYEQLAHIAELGRLSTVSLRVLPNEIGNHVSMPGGFAILSFPHRILPDTLYIEHSFGATDTEKKEEVDRAKVKFDRLRDASLDETASLALLARIADDLE